MSTGVKAITIDGMGTETYGEMIRRRRVAAGLSQEWLAERSGTNRPHLSQIERGKIGAPKEPLRSALVGALDRAERDRGIPVEHGLGPVEGKITIGGEATLGQPATEIEQIMANLSADRRANVIWFANQQLALQKALAAASAPSSAPDRVPEAS